MILSMKRLTLAVSLATLLLTPFVAAQNISVPNMAAGSQRPEPNKVETAPKGQKVVKVATITGAQVNAFYHDVNVMQAELKGVQDLQAKVEAEKNASKKKDLQTQLDAAKKKLEEDNALMVKTYRFSLTRQYIVDTEQISIYVAVSDEEAAQVEREAKEEAARQPKDQAKAKK